MKMRKRWLPFIMIVAMLIGSMGNINRVNARKTYRMTVGKKLYLKINTSKRISWSSSNKRVATVTRHGGIVKAKRPGKTIYAQFLQKNGGEYYEVVEPDSTFERMDISKIVVSKKEVEQNEKSMYIGDSVEGNIRLGSGNDKKAYVTLKNNTVTTAYCRFVVLYLDESQNIVDAVQDFAKIEPGETIERSYNKANNYYNNDYISFKSCTLKWTASDTNAH